MLGGSLMFLLTVNLAVYLVGFGVNLVYQYNLFLGRAFIDMTFLNWEVQVKMKCALFRVSI